MRLPAGGHAVFLHGLEQCRLRLRCRAVDLVGQHEVCEDRAGLELHELAAGLVLAHDRRADDVAGHQVGRELNARKLEMQHVGERLYQLGLADARNALEQDVPARQQAGHDADDVVLVADDDARHLDAHDAEILAELLDLTIDGGGGHRAPSCRVMK